MKDHRPSASAPAALCVSTSTGRGSRRVKGSCWRPCCGCAPPPRQVSQGWQLPDFLKGYVTSGQDLYGPPPLCLRRPCRCPTLSQPCSRGHRVDARRTVRRPIIGLSPWSLCCIRSCPRAETTVCDVEMDSGEAYFPLIRLALARYRRNPSPTRICRAWCWRPSSSCRTGQPVSSDPIETNRCSWRSMALPTAVPVRRR